MALDATVGGAAANSYVDLTYFNAYIASRANVPAAVTDAETLTKEQALIQATRLMRSICLTGLASTSTQRLAWPRTGMLSANGYPIDDDVIPDDWKDMQSELAMLLIVSDRTAATPAVAAGIASLKAGPVTLEFTDGVETVAIPESVTMLGVSSWFCPTDEEESNEYRFDVLL
jgi:hypothetical protein